MDMDEVYSNRVEVLYEQLVNQLFFSERQKPFSRRLVLVASPAMRSWLQLRMAYDQRLGIAAGMEMGFVEQTLISLANNSDKLIPSIPTLSLAVEVTLKKILDKDAPYLEPLKKWVGDSKNPQKQIRIIGRELAQLFQRYGTYGDKLIQEWTQKEPDHWQALLWRELFDSAKWSYPAQLLKDARVPLLDSIHLFAVSFVPKCYLEYLKRISETISVSFYLLSPCRAFWTDILSEKHQHYLLKKLEESRVSISQQFALEDLLLDTNPLLANFGRLGREMAEQFEDDVIHPTQQYVISVGCMHHPQYQDLTDYTMQNDLSNTHLTLLHAVQADMALLRTPSEEQRIEIEVADRSIQVHAVPSRWREIEVLYNLLVDAIQQSHNSSDPLTPGDIVVMAPDISAYVSYVRAVFEREGSLLPIRVMDLHLPSQSPYIKAFLILISLGKGDWENRVILELLDSFPFLRKQCWSREDAAVLRRWTTQTSVRWGFDPVHRDKILQANHCVKEMIDRTASGTWQSSLQQLCESLMQSPEEKSLLVEMADSPLLGTWWLFLNKLYNCLQPIINGEQRTIKEWVVFLRTLCEEYLDHDTDNDSAADYKSLLRILQEINSSTQHLSESILPFESISKHIEEALDRVHVSYKEGNLQAVRFCSMLPMRAVPAKIIAMVGMENDSFPKRGQDTTAFDLLKTSDKADYCPRQTDFDRYLFLETVLSARQSLLLLFPGRWKHTAHSSESLPSPLIEELIHYLDRSYTLGGKLPSELIVKEHLLAGYHLKDVSYFAEHYRWANAKYNLPRKEHEPLLGNFVPNHSSNCLGNHVTLEALQSLARNPLKDYFKHVLKTHPDIIHNKHQYLEETFDLKPRDQGLLRSHLLKRPFDQIMMEALHSGKMPFSPLKEMFEYRLQNEDQKFKRQFQEIGITPQSFFTLQFSEHFREPKKTEEGNWSLPPLKIGTWCIEGELSLVTSQGLIVYAQNQWDKLIKSWPAYLVFLTAIEQYKLPILNNLLPIHSTSDTICIHEAFLDSPTSQLENYLLYYSQTRQTPSPLIPEWVNAIMEGNVERLQKLFDSEENQFSFSDETVSWLYRSAQLPDPYHLISHWQPTAQLLYESLKTAIVL